MFCITEAPPAAEMKLGSSQAEHSLIGIVGSCARIARIAVIESVPGTRPNRMICGLAASMASTCGVTSVAPTWSIWVDTSWKPSCFASACTVPWLARQTEPQLSSSSATLV